MVPPPRRVTLVLLVAISSPAATVCEHRPRRLAASHSQSDCTLPQLRRMRSPAFCTAHRLHLCKTTSDHLESAARCRLHSPAIHRRRPISSRHDDRFRRLRPCTRLRRTAANSGGFNRSATAAVGLWPVACGRWPASVKGRFGDAQLNFGFARTQRVGPAPRSHLTGTGLDPNFAWSDSR